MLEELHLESEGIGLRIWGEAYLRSLDMNLEFSKVSIFRADATASASGWASESSVCDIVSGALMKTLIACKTMWFVG